MTTPPSITVPLYRLAHSRTGDKGNRSNISVIAWHPALWDVLVDQVTEATVAQQFAQRHPRQVTRYLLPKPQAMNIVLDEVLDECLPELEARLRERLEQRLAEWLEEAP